MIPPWVDRIGLAYALDQPRRRVLVEQAEVVEFADCGHAPPEERAPECLPFLTRFLEW